MRQTGPNFEIESGSVKSWELVPSETPEDGATAVLRLGRRLLPSFQPSFIYDDTQTTPNTYTTVYQDDTLDVEDGTVDVVLDTSGLAGVEYLWQVDLIDAEGRLTQRWRGLILITESLAALGTSA